MRTAIIFIASIIEILGSIPYMLDTVKGKTKPNVVSWFTWTLLTAIGATAALAAHEPRTAILTYANAVSTGVIILLGLKYGFAKFGWFDGLCQAGAIIGLILWLVFNSPTTAITATVTIDLIASLPTLRHCWLHPQEETWQTFFISGIGATIGLLALGVYNLNSLAYPIYLFILDFTLAFTVIISRNKKGLGLER